MKTKTLYFLSVAFLCMSLSAQAASTDFSIADTVTQAISAASNASILTHALQWLGALMLIQFLITNFGMLKSGADIEHFFAKFIGSLMWFGFCYYVLENGPDFIDSVGHGILTDFAPNIPTPSSVIAATLALCTSILAGIAVVGTSVAGIGNSSLGSVLVCLLFFIFSVGMFMAIKILMLELELGLIIMLSPLSFSFLGLNALKDQGVAPFKSLISLAYRIILMGVVCSAFTEVIDVAVVNLDKVSWSNPLEWGDKFSIIFSMVVAFPVIAYLVYKSDSIAASLASGSTNMGTGDVASAAAAGAAAGAAIASGGAAAAGAAGKASQPMGDFLKSLMGRGKGEISNAAPTGKGGPVGEPPIKPPAQSLWPTDKNGAPVRPEPSESVTSPDAVQTTNSPEPSPEPAGSGASAGIGGAGSGLEKQIGDLVDALKTPKNPTLRDRIGEANRHVAQESAATHVNISTHHAD
jgi:type IV secretion system protein TrbL